MKYEIFIKTFPTLSACIFVFQFVSDIKFVGRSFNAAGISIKGLVVHIHSFNLIKLRYSFRGTFFFLFFYLFNKTSAILYRPTSNTRVPRCTFNINSLTAMIKLRQNCFHLSIKQYTSFLALFYILRKTV